MTSTGSDLHTLLKRWRARLRLVRAVQGFVYGLCAAAATGGLLSLYAAGSGNLLREEYLFIAGGLLIVLVLAGVLAGFLWPLDKFQAARRFDEVFHLKARVSTALELEQNDSSNKLREEQLKDTVRTAAQVDFRKGLPFRLPRLPLAALAILLVLNGVFWVSGQDVFSQAQQKRSILDTIDRQAAEIEALIEEIRTDPDLTEDQKLDLIRPLQKALDELTDADSLEEAFSALEEAREKLQALENADAQDLADALQQAGQELGEANAEDLSSLAESLGNGDFGQAAEDLRELASAAEDPAAQEELANQLEALAEAVDGVNPELAGDLRQAADSARAGDAQSASEAVNRAAETLEDLEDQLAASEAAQQAGSQVQQSQSEIVSAGQSGSQGQSASNNSGGSSQGSQGSQGPGSGSGAGDGAGSQEAQSGSEAGSTPISQGNSPDGSGETNFQPISPTSLGGEGGDRVAIPSSGVEGDNITGVGPADPGSTTPITVPYTEIFPQYQNAANQAIDSGAIPPQYRDLIRDYFSSLEP